MHINQLLQPNIVTVIFTHVYKLIARDSWGTRTSPTSDTFDTPPIMVTRDK